MANSELLPQQEAALNPKQREQFIEAWGHAVIANDAIDFVMSFNQNMSVITKHNPRQSYADKVNRKSQAKKKRRDRLNIGVILDLSDELMRANALMPERALFDTDLEWFVGGAKTALAKQYEKYGVSDDDFELFSYKDKPNSETVYSVIYTGTYGIDLAGSTERFSEGRSHKDIMANDEEHKLIINGVEYDDRSLNQQIYVSFIEQQKQKRVCPLPDSQGTFCYLNTRDNTLGRVWLGCTTENEPEFVLCTSDINMIYALFRPTIVYNPQTT